MEFEKSCCALGLAEEMIHTEIAEDTVEKLFVLFCEPCALCVQASIIPHRLFQFFFHTFFQ